MEHRVHATSCGDIHYWVHSVEPAQPTLVFLPGLTADHRLFDRQIEAFEGKANVLVWDAPGHGASWPFRLDFTLEDKARWLHEILETEGIQRPVIVGQSMGGYVGQMFAQLYPDRLRGFVSVDSAPLQRRYVTGMEIWLLKRMEPVYRWFPWKWLLQLGSQGVACTDYGRSLMYDMMMAYDGDRERYIRLTGHGYRMLGEAMEKDMPYIIPCPALLVGGKKDHAGSCIRYNKAWHKHTGIPIVWLDGAGHNSNTDRPDEVNRLLADFLKQVHI